MSDSSLFIGAALPWLRNVNEAEAREVFDTLDRLITTSTGNRSLTMRPRVVRNAEGVSVSAAAEPLSRWDYRPPGVIFREGFRPRVVPVSMQDFRDPQQTDRISLNLHRFINDHVRSVFVSTTRPVMSDGTNRQVEIWRPPNINGRYRYELFAYGGVDILATFERQIEVRYAEQQEITFVGGIRPGLIRTATEYDTAGRVVAIWHNVHFDPLLNGDHAPRANELPEIPEGSYSIRFLDSADHDAQGHPPKDELSHRLGTDQNHDVDENNGNLQGYIKEPDPAASKFLPPSRVRRACMLLPSGEEAIFFADTRFVTLKLDRWNSLADTIAPGGVQSIATSWPALHEAQFLSVDAVLPNPANTDEAYFFYRENYILVNITTRKKVFDAINILDNWPSLKQVGFPTVDAAVLLSDGTAYFFRGDQYVRVDVQPGTNDDKVVESGPLDIRDYWNVLDQSGFRTVDAILQSPLGGNTYFFCDDDYVRMIIKPGE